MHFWWQKKTPSYSVILTFRLLLGRVVKNADEKERSKPKEKKIYRNANGKNDEVSAVQHMELTPMTMWRILGLFTIYIVDFIQLRGIIWWKNQGNTQKIRGNERNWMESIPNFECILNRNHVDLHMKPWRYWVYDGDWNSEQKLFDRFENKNNNWLLLRFIIVRTSYSSNYRIASIF